MKITDKGLDYILSLGFLQPSSDYPGLYLLYTWKDLQYYAGLNPPKKKKDPHHVFLELSPKQIHKLPNTRQSKVNLEKSREYFSDVLILKLTKGHFDTLHFSGEHTPLNQIHLAQSEPSPFKVVVDTKKPFHGFYSPLEPLSSTLNNIFEDSSKVWISAVPIIKDNEVSSLLVGISYESEYGLDVIDLLKEESQKINVA